MTTESKKQAKVRKYIINEDFVNACCAKLEGGNSSVRLTSKTELLECSSIYWLVKELRRIPPSKRTAEHCQLLMWKIPLKLSADQQVKLLVLLEKNESQRLTGAELAARGGSVACAKLLEFRWKIHVIVSNSALIKSLRPTVVLSLLLRKAAGAAEEKSTEKVVVELSTSEFARLRYRVAFLLNEIAKRKL